MRNDTTAMTANSARKSPNRLMTCANHTRRMTSMARTSLNVIDGGAAGADGGAPAAAETGVATELMRFFGGRRHYILKAAEVAAAAEARHTYRTPKWTR